MVNTESLIQSILKSGRAFYGAEQSLNAARLGKAAAFIVSENCPEEIRKGIEKYASLSNIPVFQFNGSRRDLATACHKSFEISVIAIREIIDKDFSS